MYFSGFDLFSLTITTLGVGFAFLLSVFEYYRARSFRNLEPMFFVGLIGISYQLRHGLYVTEVLPDYPLLYVGFIYTITLVGPVILIILRRITDYEYGGRLPMIWHFAPWLLLHIAYECYDFFFAPEVDIAKEAPVIELDFTFYTVIHLTTLAGLVGYIVYFVWGYTSFIRIHGIDMMRALKSPERIRTLYYLGFAIVGFTGAWMLSQEAFYFHIVGWLITFFLYLLLVYQFQYPDFFVTLVSDIRTQKYKRTKLTDIDVDGKLAQLEKILDTDKAYTDSDLRAKDLARSLDISYHQMSRIINENFGQSFFELINHRRVEEAKRLLSQTNHSVIDILFTVGFNSKSAFNKQFSKLVGMTPSKFREKNKKAK